MPILDQNMVINFLQTYACYFVYLQNKQGWELQINSTVITKDCKICSVMSERMRCNVEKCIDPLVSLLNKHTD